MDITLHIPVRSYVYKYCRAIFCAKGDQSDFWRLTVHLKESKFIYALLERAPHRYQEYKKNDCVLNVQIPSKIVRLKGCHISQENVDIFNDFIKQVIMDEILLFHTGIFTKVGVKAIEKVALKSYYSEKRERIVRAQPGDSVKFFWQKSIIQDILAKYDITDDELSYDMVVKYLQRCGLSQLSA